MRFAWTALLLAGCGPTNSPSGGGGTTSGGEEPLVASSSGEPDMEGFDTSSTSSSSGEEEPGTSFITDPEGPFCPALPPGTQAHCTPCSPWSQDCADGDACKPWANDGGETWRTTRCSPVDPRPDRAGESCTVQGSAWSGHDSCEAGALCWNVDAETLGGQCVSMCQGNFNEPVCGEGETCLVANDGQLTLCLPACDPLESTCGEGFGCYPNGLDGFACVREGENVHVRNFFHPHCPAGSVMTLDGCVALCDLAIEGGCEGEATCQAYYARGKAPRGLEDVGVCSAGDSR